MSASSRLGAVIDVEVPARENAPGFGFSTAGELATPELSLTEMVAAIRTTFGLDGLIDDAAIVASLTSIVATAGPRERWVRAFSSPLGRALADGGRDVNTALGRVLALLPRARN